MSARSVLRCIIVLSFSFAQIVCVVPIKIHDSSDVNTALRIHLRLSFSRVNGCWTNISSHKVSWCACTLDIPAREPTKDSRISEPLCWGPVKEDANTKWFVRMLASPYLSLTFFFRNQINVSFHFISIQYVLDLWPRRALVWLKNRVLSEPMKHRKSCFIFFQSPFAVPPI